MRPSTIVFLLGALWVIVQFVPFVGEAIAYFGGAELTGLFVDVGIALLLFEGAIGKAPRWAFAVSLALVMGYLAAAAVSKFEARRWIASTTSANNLQRLPGAASEPLVIKPDPEDESRGSSLNAQSLIQNYALTRVYTAKAMHADQFDATWLEEEDCPSQGAQPSGAVTWSVSDPLRDSQDRQMFYRGLCLHIAPSLEPNPATKIIGGAWRQRSSFFARVDEQQITIQASSGRTATVIAGRVAPLPWLPWLFIGRDISVGRDKLVFTFHRSLWTTDEQIDQLAAIEPALGLTRKSLHDRYGDRLQSTPSFAEMVRSRAASKTQSGARP